MESSVAGKYDADAGIGAVFAALADPTRRRIVDSLRAREATVGELASRLGIRTPAMSKHLTVLEHAGLVSRHPDAQRRVCRLEPAGFHDIRDWSRRYERLWSDSLDNLDGYLEQLTAEGGRR